MRTKRLLLLAKPLLIYFQETALLFAAFSQNNVQVPGLAVLPWKLFRLEPFENHSLGNIGKFFTSVGGKAAST